VTVFVALALVGARGGLAVAKFVGRAAAAPNDSAIAVAPATSFHRIRCRREGSEGVGM
jgi:hypothetical protein